MRTILCKPPQQTHVVKEHSALTLDGPKILARRSIDTAQARASSILWVQSEDSTSMNAIPYRPCTMYHGWVSHQKRRRKRRSVFNIYWGYHRRQRKKAAWILVASLGRHWLLVTTVSSCHLSLVTHVSLLSSSSASNGTLVPGHYHQSRVSGRRSLMAVMCEIHSTYRIVNVSAPPFVFMVRRESLSSAPLDDLFCHLGVGGNCLSPCCSAKNQP